MRKRKLDRRSKTILGLAAAAAVLANAGAAYAYWVVNGSGTAAAAAGAVVELKLTGRSDDSAPLYPGTAADLTVMVANQNGFPIRITAVTTGGRKPEADPEHREGGCRTTGVTASHETMSVSWNVPKNAVGVFTVPDGLIMSNSSDSACQGATFTIPLRATAISAAS